MRDRLPRTARITLSILKVATVAAIVAAGFAMAPSDAPPSVSAGLPARSGYSGYVVADLPTRTDRLVDAHRCSVSGFDDGSQPTSALVRSATGHLRFVDFETGWDVYTRHGAATLVAVCLDDPPAR